MKEDEEEEDPAAAAVAPRAPDDAEVDVDECSAAEVVAEILVVTVDTGMLLDVVVAEEDEDEEEVGTVLRLSASFLAVF